MTQFTNGLLPRQTSQRENALVSGHIVGEVRVGIDILNVVIVVQRVHAGGDNYSDQPAPLGGGGARIACGVIK